MIYGRVGAGRGVSQQILDGLPDLPGLLGYRPVPGTLNVRLSAVPDLSGPHVETGGHRFWPVTVGGVPGHIVRWRDDGRTVSVEIVSAVHLRTALGLSDGGRVAVMCATIDMKEAVMAGYVNFRRVRGGRVVRVPAGSAAAVRMGRQNRVWVRVDADVQDDDDDGSGDRGGDGLTVDELKTELKARGLPVGGNKAELQARLKEAANDTGDPDDATGAGEDGGGGDG